MRKSFVNLATSESQVAYQIREVGVAEVTGPECYTFCCDDGRFEAVKFTGNPTDEEKSKLRWRVTTEKDVVLVDLLATVVVVPEGAGEGNGEPVDTSLSLTEVLDRPSIRKLRAGDKLKVWAYFTNPQADGAFVATTVDDKPEICKFIDLIRQLEHTQKGWTGERILNGLRRLTGYDTMFFQWMYGFLTDASLNLVERVDEALDEFEKNHMGFDPDQVMDIDFGPDLDYILPNDKTTREIRHLATHEHMIDETGNATEIGIVKDCFSLDVAMGHVFTGMSAGPHRVEAVTFDLLRTLGLVDIDNLYAVTIAGDLGQSAVKLYYYQKTGDVGYTIDRYLGGADNFTEATDAELIGDIDGFLLGLAYESYENESISKVLSRYYCNPPEKIHGVTYTHCRRRFATFQSIMDWDFLVDQVETFMIAFGLFKSQPVNLQQQKPDSSEVHFLRLSEVLPPLPPPGREGESSESYLRRLGEYERRRAEYDVTRAKLRKHAVDAVAAFRTWLGEKVSEEKARE